MDHNFKTQNQRIIFFLIRYGFKIVGRDRKNISIQEKDPEVLEMEAVSPKKDKTPCQFLGFSFILFSVIFLIKNGVTQFFS